VEESFLGRESTSKGKIAIVDEVKENGRGHYKGGDISERGSVTGIGAYLKGHRDLGDTFQVSILVSIG
jgi:hypothetical protein